MPWRVCWDCLAPSQIFGSGVSTESNGVASSGTACPRSHFLLHFLPRRTGQSHTAPGGHGRRQEIQPGELFRVECVLKGQPRRVVHVRRKELLSPFFSCSPHFLITGGGCFPQQSLISSLDLSSSFMQCNWGNYFAPVSSFSPLPSICRASPFSCLKSLLPHALSGSPCQFSVQASSCVQPFLSTHTPSPAAETSLFFPVTTSPASWHLPRIFCRLPLLPHINHKHLPSLPALLGLSQCHPLVRVGFHTDGLHGEGDPKPSSG